MVMTEMAHPESAIFMQAVSEEIVHMAKELNASGIEALGTWPERRALFRFVMGGDSAIVSCGLGAQEGEIGGAIRAVADFRIIGRAITASKNHRARTREIPSTLGEVGRETESCKVKLS